MADGSSISDLLNDMTQIAQSGAGKDVKFTPAAHDGYLNLIGAFRSALAQQNAAVAHSLVDYGYVGGLHSAQNTVSDLVSAATGLNGASDTLNAYMAYLDELEKAVDAAFKSVQAQDHGR